MSKLRFSFFTVLILFTAALLYNTFLMARQFPNPLPSSLRAPLPEYAVVDLAGTLSGFRRLTADIAWVQLLQYYGSPEKPADKDNEYELSVDMAKMYFAHSLIKDKEALHEDIEHRYQVNYEGGVYRQLLQHCSRIINLDPFFSYVYLYGAGSLAWNLNRPDEAIQLLQNGISGMERYKADITKDVQQPFWQYHLYISAIIYRKMGETAKMTSMLEMAVTQPECPSMVKAVLANIYQKENKAVPALKLWIEIYDSHDPTYHERSKQKIAELRKLLKV